MLELPTDILRETNLPAKDHQPLFPHDSGSSYRHFAASRPAPAIISLLLILVSLAFAHYYPQSFQFAYVGPGAGFAFLGSFLAVITGFFVALFSLLTWPIRLGWRWIRGRRGYRHAIVRKLVFLGLDGLDPRVTERMMAEGKLPNLARLASEGSYRRLRTTFPALSPVAWSTFATGVSPARHNIFDFLDRSLRSYLPQLSSARVGLAGSCASPRPLAYSAVAHTDRFSP